MSTTIAVIVPIDCGRLLVFQPSTLLYLCLYYFHPASGTMVYNLITLINTKFLLGTVPVTMGVGGRQI